MIESKRMVTLSISSASFSAFSPQILSFFGNLKWLIKSLILISLLTILHPLATATITIQSITGVSNWVKEGDTPIIYGGFAGSEASGSCTDNGDGTCNNCLIGSQILACNEKRVMLNSQVQISISSDTVTNSGPVILTTSDGNTKIGSNGDTIGKDEVGTFKATWSTICAAVFSSGAGASCVTTTNPSPVTLKIGIDEDKNGQLSGSEGITLTLKVHLPIDAESSIMKLKLMI